MVYQDMLDNEIHESEGDALQAVQSTYKRKEPEWKRLLEIAEEIKENNTEKRRKIAVAAEKKEHKVAVLSKLTSVTKENIDSALSLMKKGKSVFSSGKSYGERIKDQLRLFKATTRKKISFSKNKTKLTESELENLLRDVVAHIESTDTYSDEAASSDGNSEE